MIQYLFDTSAISLCLRPTAPGQLVNRFRRLEGVGSIASIVLDKLRYGSLRLPHGQRRQHLEEAIDLLFEDGIPVLAFDREAAEWHAAERARLEAVGQKPPLADGLIAAIAATHDLMLITLNPRDFERFEGLRVEAR
jgi:predicted nucleic acid-binding protein